MFGGLALVIMVVMSTLPPGLVRRLGVLGFAVAFAGLALLPFFGTDFGKGAVRWYSIGFASLQPSEFLKPGFVIMGGLADGRQPGDRRAAGHGCSRSGSSGDDRAGFSPCSPISGRPHLCCSAGA